MQYGRVEGLDTDISRLAQGTMMLGSDTDADAALLDAIFAMGCNTFDLAHVYGGGKSERSFGKWIGKRGLRDRVVILDKGAHPNADRRRVTPFDIRADVHDSLARLGVERIDMYLLHRDDPDVPVAPIVDVLNELHDEGKIGVFGGSNWTHGRIEEANAYAASHGLEPFRASSPNFSLAVQIASPWGDDCISISGPAGADARRWYADKDFPLFTWSSLARGFFSGKYTRGNYSELEGTPNESSIRAYCCEENFLRLERATQLAREKGVTLAQVALSYVLSQPLNIFALVGCYTPDEFSGCVEASERRLTTGEMAWLNLEADGC